MPRAGGEGGGGTGRDGGAAAARPPTITLVRVVVRDLPLGLDLRQSKDGPLAVAAFRSDCPLAVRTRLQKGDVVAGLANELFDPAQRRQASWVLHRLKRGKFPKVIVFLRRAVPALPPEGSEARELHASAAVRVQSIARMVFAKRRALSRWMDNYLSVERELEAKRQRHMAEHEHHEDRVEAHRRRTLEQRHRALTYEHHEQEEERVREAKRLEFQRRIEFAQAEREAAATRIQSTVRSRTRSREESTQEDNGTLTPRVVVLASSVSSSASASSASASSVDPDEDDASGEQEEEEEGEGQAFEEDYQQLDAAAQLALRLELEAHYRAQEERIAAQIREEEGLQEEARRAEATRIAAERKQTVAQNEKSWSAVMAKHHRQHTAANPFVDRHPHHRANDHLTAWEEETLQVVGIVEKLRHALANHLYGDDDDDDDSRPIQRPVAAAEDDFEQREESSMRHGQRRFLLQDAVAHVLRAADEDRDGYLSHDEMVFHLCEALQIMESEEDVACLIHYLDFHGSGKICLDELVHLLMGEDTGAPPAETSSVVPPRTQSERVLSFAANVHNKGKRARKLRAVFQDLLQASRHGSVARMQELLRRGNASAGPQGLCALRGPGGVTALHYASESGNVAAARLLLDAAAAHGVWGLVNVATRSGVTPCCVAARHGDLDMVKFLVGRGASVLGGGQFVWRIDQQLQHHHHRHHHHHHHHHHSQDNADAEVAHEISPMYAARLAKADHVVAFLLQMGARSEGGVPGGGQAITAPPTRMRRGGPKT